MTDAREVIFKWLSFTGYTHEDDKESDVTSFIAALAAAGFAIVPKEPTEKMENAALGLAGHHAGVWRAMVEAATDE